MSVKNPSTYVISITCFDDQERFDPVAQRGHFRRMAAAGIGVYVGGGGSGEAFTMTPDEYRQLVQIAKEELLGKTPARVMGIEPRSAQQMIDLYHLIKPYGLEALQIYSLDAGHGRGTSMEMLERYFRDILDEVKMPCVLSSHQAVQYFIPIPMMKKLLKDYPQIIGLNITNSDIRYLVEIREQLGTRAEIHVGGPMQGLTALSLGCQGYLSSEGNLVPRLCVSVIDHYKKGDMERCFDAFGRLLQVFTRMAKYSSNSGSKGPLEVLGLPGGKPRRPRLPVNATQKAEIAKWLDELDIRKIEGIG